MAERRKNSQDREILVWSRERQEALEALRKAVLTVADILPTAAAPFSDPTPHEQIDAVLDCLARLEATP